MVKICDLCGGEMPPKLPHDTVEGLNRCYESIKAGKLPDPATTEKIREAEHEVTRAKEATQNAKARQKRIKRGDLIVCPYCHFEGAPMRKSRASTFTGCLLCLFFFVPGLLYFMIRSGETIWCPKCGVQLGRT